MPRHERMAVAMAVAEATHHSSRGQKSATVIRKDSTSGGSGQASLRSLGRREVTAAGGTFQGNASQPSACRYWLGRRESKWTAPPSDSSLPRL